MVDIIFKRSMNIGTISAESDQEFLDECFVETPEYEELLDFQNKKMILLGRTGSGKTALLNKLKDVVDYYIEIKPDTFALQYIMNVPFVSKLIQEKINLDVFYKFLWLHEIISQIIKKYFAYNRRNFIDSLSEKVSDLGRIRELKKYLSEYDGIFFDEGSTEKITRDIEKQVSALVGNDFANIQGKLTDAQRQEIQTKASQYINKKQIGQLKNIITLFKEYFESNKQKKIVVVIDNLDENWINDEFSKYKLIDALLNAIRLFIDIPNLKILIAMRADLLAKTCETTKRQNEKDESFTLRLDWTRKMLNELLDKRIEYLFKYKYKKNCKITFSDIFNFKIDNVEATDYILDRTMMRPRDAINFVNLCLIQADNENKITQENVLDAERNFRTERFKALDHEWINIYGNIETYIKILYKLGNNFAYADFFNGDTYSDVEIIIYEASKQTNNYLAEKFYDRLGNDKYAKEANVKELLNILFTIGLIGIKEQNNKISFSTPHRSTLTELDFAGNLTFETHPLFKKQ